MPAFDVVDDYEPTDAEWARIGPDLERQSYLLLYGILMRDAGSFFQRPSPPGLGGVEQDGVYPDLSDNMVGRPLDYDQRLRFQRQQLEALFGDRSIDWTFEELFEWLKTYKDRRDSTIDDQLRALRRMASHPVMPVRISGKPVDVVKSFYEFYRYRRDIEKAGPTATKNDFTAIRALGSFLGIPPNVWPTRPKVPRRERRVLPTPEQIYDLLHQDYAADGHHSYENALVRYLLVLDFGIGVRFPSEPWALKLSDFDPVKHTLVVTEPKKGSPRRRLLIEPEWLCCSPRHASLAQYLHWRKKVDVGGSDALFLTPTGEPFADPLALSRFLERRVKRFFPWYHGYLGRTWCANARLVEWKHDHARVANWMGHEGVDMLRSSYEQDARIHEKMYGKNWLFRAFVARRKEAPQIVPVDEAQGVMTLAHYEGPKLAFSGARSPVRSSAAVGI